jgi:hypothetical protein
MKIMASAAATKISENGAHGEVSSVIIISVAAKYQRNGS